MTFAFELRIWFLVLFSLALVAAIIGIVRILPHCGEVEKQFGPVPPTPPPVVLSIICITILLTRFGEISADWQSYVCLVLYSVFMPS